MGIVKTNAFAVGSDSGSGGGANGADLPTHLKALSANGGNGFVTLSIEYENTDFVSGVQVNYKLGDYPTSPSDGDSVSVEGAPTSIKVEGLTNKLEYYFRVFPYNEVDGTKYYQTDVTNAKVECIPKALEIIGATIFEEGDGYVALITSQDFTLSAPAGTKITLGGGGLGGTSQLGGRVKQHILTSPVENQVCSLDIGGAVYGNNYTKQTNTTLKIGNTVYDAGAVTNASPTITTKFGIIGGKGADAGITHQEGEDPDDVYIFTSGGDGGGARAGKGGIASRSSYSGGDGGCNGTKGTRGTQYSYYGTQAAGGKGANGCGDGGNGSGVSITRYSDVDEGSTYERRESNGGGGGGGFSGGGGGSVAGGGYGGQGIAVIEYPE